MTKLTMLGTGSAFCLENYHTNILVESNGKKMLIDAGGDLRFALQEIQLSFMDIDAVYITHLHFDHIGGMEYLALSSYFHPDCNQIKLICHKDIAKSIWPHALQAGLESVQGRMLNLDDYFDLIRLADKRQFNWQNLVFEPIQMVHIFNGQEATPNYGLLFSVPSGKKVYFTSDCQFDPDKMNQYYKQADIIIHDCETTPIKTGVHAHYEDLKTISPQFKNKIFLTHYNDNVVKDFSKWQSIAKKDGFQGFLTKGSQLVLDE